MNKLDKAMERMGCGRPETLLTAKDRKKLNDRVHHLLRPTYFERVPVAAIQVVLRDEGCVLLQEDDTEWEGMLLGREGRGVFPLAFVHQFLPIGKTKMYVPITNACFVLTWHQMDSGRYEVIGYIS